jgi:hypothetical protein
MTVPTLLLSFQLSAAPTAQAQEPPLDAAQVEALQQRLEEEKARRLELEARHAELLRQTGRQPGGAATVAVGQPVVIAAGDQVDEATSMGGDLLVHGQVAGDVVALGGDVRVFPGGRVEGSATALGGTVLVDPGGVVLGDKVSLGGPGLTAAAIDPSRPFSALTTWLAALQRRAVQFLTLAGAGVMVVGLFPDRVNRVAATFDDVPFQSFFLGSLAAGSLLLSGALLTILTLGLGIPVTLLFYAFLAVLWLLGFVGLCQAAGDRFRFLGRPQGRWLAFLLGALAVTFVSSLPWIGLLALAGFSSAGIGAALLSRLGAR